MLPEEQNNTSISELVEVLRTNNAFQRIRVFASHFSELHIVLAMHAALPLGLSQELVRQIRIEFVNTIPDNAVKDLLNSPLCRYVGGDLYEIYPDVRDLLLDELKSDPEFGPSRVVQISKFLGEYAKQALEGTKYPEMQDFLESQKWVALAYTQPKDAAQYLADHLCKAITSVQWEETIWLTGLIKALANPLVAEETLLLYGSGIEKLAMGDMAGAKTQLKLIEKTGQSPRVGDISLPTFDELFRLTTANQLQPKEAQNLSPIYVSEDIKSKEQRESIKQRSVAESKEIYADDSPIKVKQRLITTVNEIGFTHDDFAALLDKYGYHFSPGDIVPGTVFSIEQHGALIDIGAETAAYLPIQEMSINQVDSPEEVLKPNETREFYILTDENEEGQLTLSIRRIEYMRAWERVRQLQADDVTVHSHVFATNRGGVLVRVEGLRGFIPGSHISTRKPKEELVGEELPLKFLEVDEERNRLVLSHRRALVERKTNHLEVGEVVVGTVRGIKPYGIFIDIGGVSGLLHVSEISHKNSDTPHEVFHINDEVKVMIIDLDAERGRISLSTKQLESKPSQVIKKR